MSTRKLTILALFLSVIISACGGNATPTATPAPTNPPATTEPTAVPTEEATVEDAPVEATEEIETASATDDAATPEAEADTEGDVAGSADGVVVTITQIDTSLRSGPGTGYEVVGRATVNDAFPAVARYGEGRSLWYQIMLPDGTLAWAWSRVSTLTPAEADLPTAAEIPPTPAS